MKKKHIKWWIIPVVIILSIGLVYAYFATKPNGQSGQNANQIKELKQKNISEGYYTVRAYVIDQYQCNCPRDALCEPCFDWITISDTSTPPKDSTILEANQLRIYTEDAGMFNNGMDYTFKLFVSNPATRSSIDYPNGIELVEYNQE